MTRYTWINLLLCATTLSFMVPHGSTLAQSETPESSRYEIGLSMYSLRQLFQSGKLNAYEYPAFVKRTFGITKIDVWDGAYPKGWREDERFLPELKRRADLVGSEIFLVMSGTVNAESGDESLLKQNGLMYQSAVDQAVILGADYVRVFLTVAKDTSEAESIRRAGIALGALADYAKSRGVTVAIEPSPHTPLGAYLAKLMRAMDHTHCKLMPDFGKMKGTDIYQGTQDMMPYSVVVSAKTHNFNKDGSAEGFEYPRLMEIVRSSGFTGIVAIEYEGENLDPVQGVRATKKLLEQGNR